MYALKVSVNNQSPIIAGASDLGVLSAIVTCVGKLGEASKTPHNDQDADLFLSVTGLTSREKGLPDEHLRWRSNWTLQVGDIVSVELVDAELVDAPVSGEEAEKTEHDEREYFEHCRQTYFELREKYEG